MKLRLIVNCVFLAFSASVACAQGVIHRLPPEGTWSRYRVTTQVTSCSTLRVPNAIPKEIRDSVVNAMPKAGMLESALTISIVGTEVRGDAKLQWIEIVRKTDAREILYRLLVPESSFSVGGDVFRDAVRFLVKKPDAVDGKPEEIDDPARRASESVQMRSMFPPFPTKCEQQKISLMIGSGTDGGAGPVQGDTYRFHFKFAGKPPGGGPLASCRHEADYFGIVSNRAPFGGDQLWMTNGITVESGDCLTEARDDVTITMFQGNMQISLIESGTGAVSRFKKKEK
jgi:hypothetical protein